MTTLKINESSSFTIINIVIVSILALVFQCPNVSVFAGHTPRSRRARL